MFPFPSYVRFVSSRTVRVSPSTSVYVSFTGRPKSLYVYVSSVVKVPPVRNDVLSVIFSISPYALYAYERRLLYLSNVIAPFSICPSNCHTPIGTRVRPPPLATPE